MTTLEAIRHKIQLREARATVKALSVSQSPMQLLSIQNKVGKVRLNDSVNPASINKLIDEIAKVFGATAAQNGLVSGEITACIENAADRLEIEINSPGGSVFEGYRLYHAITEMRQRGVYVTATINSLAASMGSIIAMAADRIGMVEGGRMMIHEPSQAIHGGEEDHKRAAKMLGEVANEMAGIYARRTRKPVSAMRELMKKETWMGAKEAKAAGFIDQIVTGGKVTGSAEPIPATLTGFAKVSAAFAAQGPARAATAADKPAVELTGFARVSAAFAAQEKK